MMTPPASPALRRGRRCWVDLHVHPAGRTPWPADSRVVFERRAVETGTLPFGEFNASGPRPRVGWATRSPPTSTLSRQPSGLEEGPLRRNVEDGRPQRNNGRERGDASDKCAIFAAYHEPAWYHDDTYDD
jgi:hypothetical protein